jgi:hypothetical protein
VHRKLRARRCLLFRGAYTKPPDLIILTEFIGKGETLKDRINSEYRALKTEAKAAAAPKAAADKGLLPPESGATASGSGGGSGTGAKALVPPPPPPPAEDEKPKKGEAATSAAAAPSTTSDAAQPSAAAAPASTAANAAAVVSAGPSNALSLAMKLRIALQIVEGLNELHHQNPPVVHRYSFLPPPSVAPCSDCCCLSLFFFFLCIFGGYDDSDLKPTNVLLDKHCNVKLCDFGFSHLVHHNHSSAAHEPASPYSPSGGGGSRTKAGTPLYKAPEAWDGDPERGVGTASDVYSFGIVLHELFCGHLPWAGKRVEQISALHLVSKQSPPAHPELVAAHPRIAHIFESCTRHSEAKRPNTEQLLSMVRALFQAYHVPLDDD